LQFTTGLLLLNVTMTFLIHNVYLTYASFDTFMTVTFQVNAV